MRIIRSTMIATALAIVAIAPAGAQPAVQGTITECTHAFGSLTIECTGTLGAAVVPVGWVAINPDEVPLSVRAVGPDGLRFATDEEIDIILGGVGLERPEIDLIVPIIHDLIQKEIEHVQLEQGGAFRDFLSTEAPQAGIVVLEEWAAQNAATTPVDILEAEPLIMENLRIANIEAYDGYIIENPLLEPADDG